MLLYLTIFIMAIIIFVYMCITGGIILGVWNEILVKKLPSSKIQKITLWQGMLISLFIGTFFSNFYNINLVNLGNKFIY